MAEKEKFFGEIIKKSNDCQILNLEFVKYILYVVNSNLPHMNFVLLVDSAETNSYVTCRQPWNPLDNF